MDASILSVLLMLSASTAAVSAPTETMATPEEFTAPQQVMLHDEIDLEDLAPAVTFEEPLRRAA